MTRLTTVLMIAGLLTSLLGTSCATRKNDKNSETMTQELKPSGMPSPPAIVYKTKGDYDHLVPVILSGDKLKVVSFPAQSDIKINDKFPYPDKLEDGYLLDNRGINQNAAFLKFTYEDYYNMDNIPTAERLINYILDNDPFVEIYEVGRLSSFKDPVNEINQIIKNGGLDKMKNLRGK